MGSTLLTLKEKNVLEQTVQIKEMDRKSIDNRLSGALNRMCNILITEGIAQHRDEARLLIEDALKTPRIQAEIIKLAAYRIKMGHIGFKYKESSDYKNVNFD